jgi:hypothetical protein
MRLKPDTVQALVGALEKKLVGTSAQLFLFGSRTNDRIKGGDIDLLLLVADSAREQQLKLEKHHLLSALKSAIGDQRIDLKISNESDATKDAFLSTVLPSAIKLHEWK